MNKVRVLIVDDHVIVRDGVRMILEAQPDIEVVGEASDGREALERTRQLLPSVVLMDIAMPGMNGLEATAAIRQELPDVQVLILTMHEDYEYFFEVLRAGASGYALKGASSNDLVSAIRAVHQGGVYLHPAVAKNLVSDYVKRMEPGEDRARYDGLSDRERQVLKLVAEGKTSQQIAEELFLSVNTVQTHRAHIMEKLGLHNRTDLIRYALRKGLVEE
ncbi:MAG: response regulator transcription factor [Dehalococcoidia bacterium]|nr:response regulator transcription factor [Dehalococcoidia bacterium]